MGRQEQIISERIRKLKEIQNSGIDPYPQNFEPKEFSTDLIKKFSKISKGKVTGHKTKIAGRLMNFRDFGKISFGLLQDSKGKIQITFRKDETSGETLSFVKKYIDVGDIVGIEGIVHKTESGELSVLTKKLTILSKSIFPLPEKWHGLQDKEERYRKRYLDLIMNSDSRIVFETREKIINVVRTLLREKDFMEVETPVLQSIYGGASANPFKTHLNALDTDLFLSISPELYLKRLIVGGFDRVFTICKNFRNEGIDYQHNPEFTMMEYYAAYKDYEFHMDFTEELFRKLIKELKIKDKIKYRGKIISLKPPFKRIKFRDLILRETDIDINKTNNFDSLKEEIMSKNIKEINISNCHHYGDLLDELYKRVARPKIIQPTFLTHYPVEMIALAKRNKKDQTKINSVQLLIDGAEVIKAYDELNDPIDQENRLREQQSFLQGGAEFAMPLDEDFISALKYAMPPTAGYGLGIDRLTMILTGQESIRDVILFPFMKPEVD